MKGLGEPMKTFHILAPGTKTKTLCGAPRTDYDIRYSWQAIPGGDYQPCEKCIEVKRSAAKQKRKVSQ